MESDAKPAKPGKKWLLRVLRWTVAVVGIAWVVGNINLRDHVLMPGEGGRPAEAVVLGDPAEDAVRFSVRDPLTGQPREVTRADLLMRPDHTHVRLRSGQAAKVLAVRPLADFNRDKTPTELLVEPANGPPPLWVAPADVEGGYVVKAEFPLREIGLARMVREANPLYLLLSVGVFPLVFVLTSWRWWRLLRAAGIGMTLWRAVQLNMVGTFYNTFMPGSTGGDVLKAYYAAKNAPEQRTAAVVSVVVDRAIGLLALVVLGGSAAALQWHIPECRRVAIVSAAVCTGVVVGFAAMKTPALRGLLGLNWLRKKLPTTGLVGERVDRAVAALRRYGRRPGLMVGMLATSLPVHAIVVVSATLAGWAFGLRLDWTYYWVVVPTVVLAGAIPISPQGAGVMEFFAILLLRPQGCTVGQAFALTLSIRLVQVLWNLTGGLFVLRGGFSKPVSETVVPAAAVA